MGNTLAELLTEQLGIKTYSRENPVVSQIQTTATLILRQDPSRIGFLYVNLSSENHFIAPLAGVASDNGVFVGPSGGNVQVVYTEDFDLPGRAWFAVAGAANSDFLVIEVLLLAQREGR